MIQNKRNILVTKPLKGPQIEQAKILGLKPIVQPALEFEFPEYWDEILNVLNKYRDSDWIFTSSNGVKALEKLMIAGLAVRPQTNVFAVGSKTKYALEQLGVKAKTPVQENSAGLAELIIREGKVRSVIYFHGNLSRMKLVQELGDQNIDVICLEVYKTHIRPVDLPREHVEAILFFSPSAVKAFKMGTGFQFEGSKPKLFAIGPTTEASLRKVTNQKVVTANEPTVETLLEKVSQILFKKEGNMYR